jgi:molybdopterin molybdotransferase
MKGVEIAVGDLALAKNTLLTPAAIGFLAGLGIKEVAVYPKPVVHIIITGNELQRPATPLQPGQVYESNSVMLQTALLQIGISKTSITFAKDDIAELTVALENALQEADLVLLTGGVSVGNYDFVVAASEACGIAPVFHKIAQRPGKPLFAGKKGNKIIFGLPGNPASVLTCFYVYVTKAIESMSGRKNLLQTKQLLLSAAYSKKIKLTQFLKAYCTEDEVTVLQAQESFRLSSFSLANCLVVLPGEKMEFAEGEPVETILLPYL